MATWTTNGNNSDKQYFAQPVPVIERRRRIRSGGGGGGEADAGGSSDEQQTLDDLDIADDYQQSGETE